MSQPFDGTANDANGQAGCARLFLEFRRVPRRDRFGDLGLVGWHAEEATPLGRQMRKDARCHHPTTVSSAKGHDEERVVEDERVGGGFVVDRRMPEGAGVDGVHRFAEIEMEVLRRTSAESVQTDRRHPCSHQRNADAGTEPVNGRKDRVLPGEGDRGTRLCTTQTDVAQ